MIFDMFGKNKLYQPYPPPGIFVCGTVTDDKGMTGALGYCHKSKRHVRVNAGVISSLPNGCQK